MRFISLVISFLLIVSSPLHAAGTYFNFGSSALMYEEETALYRARWVPIKAQVTLGRHFNDYIGIEGRLGTGLISSTVEINNTEIEVDAGTGFAGYVRLNFNDSDKFRPYALLGHSDNTLENDSTSVNMSGTSYGLGVAFKLPKRVNTPQKRPFTYIEYIDHPDEEDPGLTKNLDAINVGMSFQFE